MNVDVTNFKNYTYEDYLNNLLRLGIENYESLVGKNVYYVKPSYGVHTILEWNPSKAEYLLYLDGDRFWSDPFRINLI